jgi:hypothetical protein
VLLGFYGEQLDSSLRRLRRLGGKLAHEYLLCRERARRSRLLATAQIPEITEICK